MVKDNNLITINCLIWFLSILLFFHKRDSQNCLIRGERKFVIFYHKHLMLFDSLDPKKIYYRIQYCFTFRAMDLENELEAQLCVIGRPSSLLKPGLIFTILVSFVEG